jgi:drug/metabolite transporter (DMT)-like permease
MSAESPAAPLAEPPSLARGRLLIVAAAVLWSLSGFFVKSAPLAVLPTAQRGAVLACYRALFAGLFFLPLTRWSRVRWRWALLPAVLSFASMNFLFVTAMTRTTAAAAVFLMYTSTVWTFLFGVLFLKERLDRGNVTALVCALAGIGWIVAADWHGENFAGNLLALASGVAYAGVLLSLRMLRDESAPWVVSLLHFGAALPLLPWVLGQEIALTGIQWTLVGAMGVVQLGIPYVLFARGVRSVPVNEASLLLLLEPILNPVWVLIFWGEPVPTPTWIGGGLIVGGLAAQYVLRGVSLEGREF